MNKKIEFGLAVPSGMRDKARRPQYMEDVARLLEVVKGHYGSAWFVDHLQSENNDHMEGWTAVSYLSALHPELQWGHAVLCQSFRNPALLAKMGATLQFMSGGRFILGMGAGWHEEEYLAYGYPFPSAGQRVEELDEAMHVIKALWTEERATFEGKHYRVREAYCEPKPDPLPTVMIGGAKPKMLRLIARHADWWNVSWTPIEEYLPQVEECERACEEVGRDPATLRRTWFGGCACAPTEKGVEEISGGRLQPGNAFVGTPQQLLDQMAPFVELGVDYFMLGCGGFPALTTVETLVSEVLPALNRS